MEKDQGVQRRFYAGICIGFLLGIAATFGIFMAREPIGNVLAKWYAAHEQRDALNGDDVPKEWRQCSQDTDCVRVSAGCCGCGMGGTGTAVNKEFEDEWQAEVSAQCMGTLCPAVISDDPTCVAHAPACKRGKCILE